MISVLSFVAEIPLEHPCRPFSRPKSTVTGVLPLVCRKFRELCKSDYFWKLSLQRMQQSDSFLWGAGILRLLPHGTVPEDDPLEQVHNLLQLDYKSIYRRVLDSSVRFTGPVFVKTGDVRLGQDMEWHFREPRHQLLISLVMQGWPDSARRGEPVCANQNGEWPTFVYAYMAPFARAMPACLVQVHNCMIFPDGSVDVNVRVRAHVWLERAWERPDSGRLFEVTCLRMTREEVRQMQDVEGGGFAQMAAGDDVTSPIVRERVPQTTRWQHIMDPTPLYAFGSRSRPLESDERINDDVDVNENNAENDVGGITLNKASEVKNKDDDVAEEDDGDDDEDDEDSEDMIDKDENHEVDDIESAAVDDDESVSVDVESTTDYDGDENDDSDDSGWIPVPDWARNHRDRHVAIMILPPPPPYRIVLGNVNNSDDNDTADDEDEDEDGDNYSL